MKLIMNRGGNRFSLDTERGETVANALERAGIPIARVCGGRTRCGKCAVKIDGLLDSPTTAEELVLASKPDGMRLACRAVLLGDAEVFIPDESGIFGITAFLGEKVEATDKGEGRGWAVDIGTTTVAVYAVSLADGRIIHSECFENPQTAYGADVITRISYCSRGGLDSLSQPLRHEIDKHTNVGEKRVITGNTVMLSLFAGLDVSSMGIAPYPSPSMFGREYGNDYIPRCFHAFAGADLLCAVLSSGMLQSRTPTLLADLGTNGELALWDGKTLLCCSVAAGPCFEGGNIKNGMAARAGAIDRVWYANEKLNYSVIPGANAMGFCGSGIIDTAAALVASGIADRDGRMKEDCVIGGVRFTPTDLRQLQLAKAAVAAGISALIRVAGLSVGDISAFYLAGGFGSCLDPMSAAAIGMFPERLVPVTKAIGNAAGMGAVKLLLSASERAKAASLADAAKYIDLSTLPDFTNAFVDHICF